MVDYEPSKKRLNFAIDSNLDLDLGSFFFHFSTLHCSTIFVNFSKTTVTQYELIFIIIIIYLNTVQYSFIKVQIQWLDIKHKTYEANKDIKER